MGVRGVQVSGVVRPRIKEYRWIQGCNPAQLALLGLQVVGYQSSDMGAHTVADEVQVVRLDAARMPGQVLDQLGDAQTAEPRGPFHLAEAGLLHCVTVVHDDDVVLAHTEVGLPQVRTRTESPSAAEAVDDDLGGVAGIEVRVVEGVCVQDIDELGLLLGASGVQVELDLGVGTAVGLLQARFCHIDLGLVLASSHCRGHHSGILASCEDVRWRRIGQFRYCRWESRT